MRRIVTVIVVALMTLVATDRLAECQKNGGEESGAAQIFVKDNKSRSDGISFAGIQMCGPVKLAMDLLKTPISQRAPLKRRGSINVTRLAANWEGFPINGVLPAVDAYNFDDNVATLVFCYYADDPAQIASIRETAESTLRRYFGAPTWKALDQPGYDNGAILSWAYTYSDGVAIYVACKFGEVADAFADAGGVPLMLGQESFDESSPDTPVQTTYKTEQKIVYSQEYQGGVRYQVGTSKDYTVYLAAFNKSNSGRKRVLKVLVVNHGKDNVTFIPDAVQVIHTTSKGRVRGDVFNASEWTSKQEKKALTAAILLGFASGYANSQPGYGSGTYTDAYGRSGSFTYTYYDSAAAASRAMHDAALWGGVISRNFEQATSGLAVAETLSPGEFTGGEIHVQKAPAAITSTLYTIQLGSDYFNFNFSAR